MATPVRIFTRLAPRHSGRAVGHIKRIPHENTHLSQESASSPRHHRASPIRRCRFGAVYGQPTALGAVRHHSSFLVSRPLRPHISAMVYRATALLWHILHFHDVES